MLCCPIHGGTPLIAGIIADISNRIPCFFYPRATGTVCHFNRSVADRLEAHYEYLFSDEAKTDVCSDMSKYDLCVLFHAPICKNQSNQPYNIYSSES